MSELAELRATLARAQRELEAAASRLDTLESVRKGEASATVLIPRAVDRQRRKMIIVGAVSSLGTAALLGIFALAFSNDDPPPPRPPLAIAPLPPAPPPVLPPPAPSPTVVEQVETPTPLPAPPEPPRPPTRVARVRHAEPPAEPEGTGQLTIVCLPARCDAISDNGVAIGPGHIFNRPVPAGMHSLVLHAVTGEKKTISVVVQADRTKEVRVNMRPDVSDVF